MTTNETTMLGAEMPLHVQNLYLACAAAIPAFFVALSVQTRPTSMKASVKIDIWPFSVGVEDIPVPLQAFGLVLMLAGEIACLVGLLADSVWVGWKGLAFAGVVIGAGAVLIGISPDRDPQAVGTVEPAAGAGAGGAGL